jgi:hypothetical protein
MTRMTLLAAVALAACGGGSSSDGAGAAAAASGAGSAGAGASPADCSGVDLETDPTNCGMCGRTCVVKHAEAACQAGDCALGACDLGWADCDGDVDTGCEVEIACDEGGACATACGSQGGLACADVCAPVCAPPAEACNAVDDDCDGACDQGAIAGCRVGVHRAYNAGTGHLFTIDLAEATAWGLESANFFYLYVGAAADLRPFQRCGKPNGNFFYSESNDCEMTGAPLGTLGFIAPAPMEGMNPTCGAAPLYRIYNVANNWHFYTTSLAERDAALAGGWSDQGIAGYVWAAP